MTAYDDIRAATIAAEVEHGVTLDELADAQDTIAAQSNEIAELKAALAECEGGPPDPPDPPTGGLSPILVPAGNGILLGCSVPSSGWSSWVTAAGGKLPHIWHEYATSVTQLQADINACPKGCIPLLNYKPAGTMGLAVYQNIVARQYDTQLRQAAGVLKAYAKPLFLAIHHEPEDDGDVNSDDECKAAYRYCVEFLRNEGATNVVYIWNMMGIPEHGTRYTGLYPGDDVVDWIGMDPYITTSTTVDTWNELLNRTVSGWNVGFYNWAKPHNKPIMLCEWGIGSGVAGNAAPKMMGTDMPNLLTNHPLVKAMVYWNQLGTRADYRITAAGWPTSQVGSYVNRPEFQIDISGVAK